MAIEVSRYGTYLHHTLRSRRCPWPFWNRSCNRMIMSQKGRSLFLSQMTDRNWRSGGWETSLDSEDALSWFGRNDQPEEVCCILTMKPNETSSFLAPKVPKVVTVLEH
jgi:hypothetical protein